MSISRNGKNELVSFLETTNFYYDPASAMYHGAFKGGLAQHSLCVFNMLYDFREKGFFEASYSTIVIVSILHDICKLDSYSIYQKNVKENDKWIQVEAYKNEFSDFPYGHGEKSVDVIRNFIDLTVDEKLAIRWHMGPYEGERHFKELGHVQEICPLAFWLNVADMFASKYLC